LCLKRVHEIITKVNLSMPSSRFQKLVYPEEAGR
jgi:hypothetical protein